MITNSPAYRCQQSVFVDREDYENVDIMACPFPSCNYHWCKSCEGVIDLGVDPPHSCNTAQVQEHPQISCDFCHDTHADGDIFRTKPCAHAFCRTCFGSILSQGHFPILCPICPVESLIRKISKKLLFPIRYRERRRRLLAAASMSLECPR